jgi:hypothetical protein
MKTNTTGRISSVRPSFSLTHFYRAGLKKKLLEMADTVPLAPMSPIRKKKVRAFVRETVDTLTTNNVPK